MKNLTFVLFALTTLVGCARTNTTMISNVKYPAISPESVTIFLDEEDLPYEFEKVAIINIVYTQTFDNKKWKAAKKKAASLGCNGIYERYNQMGYGEDGDRSEIIAIRY